MSLIAIRKKLLNVETTYHEGGAVAPVPVKIGVIAVVVHNPFAGRYADAGELAAFVGHHHLDQLSPQQTSEWRALLIEQSSVTTLKPNPAMRRACTPAAAAE